MTSIAYRIIAVLLLIATLGGCHTIQQESAMEWMQRQPWIIDP
jgi:hypothetical protein